MLDKLILMVVKPVIKRILGIGVTSVQMVGAYVVFRYISRLTNKEEEVKMSKELVLKDIYDGGSFYISKLKEIAKSAETRDKAMF